MSPSRHQTIKRGNRLQRQNVIFSFIQRSERVPVKMHGVLQSALISVTLTWQRYRQNFLRISPERMIDWSPGNVKSPGISCQSLFRFRQTLYSRTEPYDKGREQTLKLFTIQVRVDGWECLSIEMQTLRQSMSNTSTIKDITSGPEVNIFTNHPLELISDNT